MVEVTLELLLDSFLVNSVGGTGELAGKMPATALRFVCENVMSARRITEHAPTAEFDFLGAAGKQQAKTDPDSVFDEQLYKYLTTHTTVDISRVDVSSEASGYSTKPKGESTGEIGRMMLAKSAEQNKMAIELVLKNEEFDAIWRLTTKREIEQVIAKLVCFRLRQENPPARGETFLVAGIVSSSLQIVPGKPS